MDATRGWYFDLVEVQHEAGESEYTPEFRAAAVQQVIDGRRSVPVARIYAVFPLRCPRCGAEMRIVAFITDPSTIRGILVHLGEPPRTPRRSRNTRPAAAPGVAATLITPAARQPRQVETVRRCSRRRDGALEFLSVSGRRVGRRASVRRRVPRGSSRGGGSGSRGGDTQASRALGQCRWHGVRSLMRRSRCQPDDGR